MGKEDREQAAEDFDNPEDEKLLEPGNWRHELRAMGRILGDFLFSTEGCWVTGIACGFLSFFLRRYLSD